MENERLSRYYTTLFNAMTDAIDALDRQDFGTARTLLVRGQQEAEAAFVRSGGTDRDADGPS